MKNNDKKPLNSLIDIDKKILPFFSNPIVLKRISDQKKNKNLNLLNPQKKLIYKIIKLNENLVKFSTSIKKYNLNLDSFFLSNQYDISPVQKNGSHPLSIPTVGRNKSEFILFIRNNLYYNLKFRLSNILYKVEKFTPVLKFHSLLNNINLFVPKRLFKPQPYIRFTYRMIRINNNFNFKKTSVQTAPSELQHGLNLTTSPTIHPIRTLAGQAGQASPLLQTKSMENASFPVRGGGQHSGVLKAEGYKTILPMPLVSGHPAEGAREKVLIKIINYNDQPSHTACPGLSTVNITSASHTKASHMQGPAHHSIIQLYKFDNGRSIKYILLKLNNLLNEIENMINIKNKLIKKIKVTNILKKNLSNFDSNGLVQEESIIFSSPAALALQEGGAIPSPATPTDSEINLSLSPLQQQLKQKERVGSRDGIPFVRHSDQSVKNLRLKIKKINSYNSNNNNTETYPLLVEAGMVKENIMKIDQANLTIPGTNLHQAGAWAPSPYGQAAGSQPNKQKGLIGAGFDTEKDIINQNSNPVDLLYFNNNLKKPVINQYLKSMSTYNMITNGTILYYSNIIGFNFKKRIRAYLPFIKSISVAKLKDSTTQPILPSGDLLATVTERLTSPYTFRGLRKVVGALDKGKFSVFGRGIENNKLINNIYKFLYLSFKSMYCLISKPVFIIKSNKIIIQLFYFLLIPKIFKHIKSKTNYKSRNKKKLYREFLKKKKKQVLATFFETRFKLKEDALKVKHFSQLGLMDTKSAQLLKYETFYQEWLKLRNIEENFSGVKFDNFGKVTFKSLEEKFTEIQNKALLPAPFFRQNDRGNERLRRQTKQNFYIKKLRDNRNKIKKNFWFYKTFFKRFEFNKNNHLPLFWQHTGGSHTAAGEGHILRIPRKWVNAKKKNPNPKFFKYLALTYLNIFKFKVSHPMLNRIKLKLRWFQKELIRDKSYLLYDKNYILNTRKAGKGGSLEVNGWKEIGQVTSPALRDEATQVGPEKLRRNKFNSYNKINWFLFKKLFWSIRLSKKIIPNAKILQKLGIPQWCWPYNSINKKGYSYADQTKISNLPIFNYNSPLSTILYDNSITKEKPAVELKGSSYGSVPIMMQPALEQGDVARMGARPLSIVGQKRWEVLQQTEGGKSSSFNNWESSWPFSLLMPPAFKQKFKKVNHSNVYFNNKLNKEGLVVPGSLADKNQELPFSKKQSRYRITELDTKRYHLMKLANINLIKIYPLKFEKLCEVLNSIFNKPVELDLIRLHYPYNDSNILVRLLAVMINKLKVRRITRRLFNKAVIKSIKKINNKDQVNIIPAFLSGMTIKVAGRLMKYKVIPRKTVRFVRKGSSSIGKVNFSDISRYTNKNKRGSFSITINSGQNFF